MPIYFLLPRLWDLRFLLSPQYNESKCNLVTVLHSTEILHLEKLNWIFSSFQQTSIVFDKLISWSWTNKTKTKVRKIVGRSFLVRQTTKLCCPKLLVLLFRFTEMRAVLQWKPYQIHRVAHIYTRKLPSITTVWSAGRSTGAVGV